VLVEAQAEKENPKLKVATIARFDVTAHPKWHLFVFLSLGITNKQDHAGGWWVGGILKYFSCV
jgi:hypothetical protein